MPLGKFVTRRRAVLERLTQGGDRELQLAKFTTIRRLVGGKRDQRVELRHVFASPFGNVSLADVEKPIRLAVSRAVLMQYLAYFGRKRSLKMWPRGVVWAV